MIKQFKDWLLKWSFLFASYCSKEHLANNIKHNAEIKRLREYYQQRIQANEEAVARYYLDRETSLIDLVEKLSDTTIEKDSKGNYTVTYTINEYKLKHCDRAQVELLANEIGAHISGEIRNYLFSQHNFYDSLKFW